MTCVRIIRGGLMTTVQDLGRSHVRHYGISVGGAMDRASHELANSLVQNPTESATLEMTLHGDELEWSFDAVIAITGADLRPVISNAGQQKIPVPQERPVGIGAGTRIEFQTARKGCRCYVAVAGGIAVPLVMGSRSTFLRASIGGYLGRRLKSGDELPIAAVVRNASQNPGGPNSGSGLIFADLLPFARSDETSAVLAPTWCVRPLEIPGTDLTTLRIIPGAHFPRLTTLCRAEFLNDSFVVSAQSDRMGYRLTGPVLFTDTDDELLSEGVAVGTLQLPPDGNPILLMADSAPTGGYPRIGHVIAADLPRAAQLRPGQRVAFQEVTLRYAHALLRQQQIEIQRSIAMAKLLLNAGRSGSASH